MTDQRLDQLLRDCTVRIKVNRDQGTGFFVAPGLILTCAHVVEKAGSNPVNVFWKDEDGNHTAKIEQLLNKPTKEQLPDKTTVDLALLRLTDKIPNHPCVYFDCIKPEIDDKLYGFGYPKNSPDGGSFTCIYEGPSFRGNSLLLTLKEGQVDYGASGSPLLNRHTCRVCGIVILSRNPTTDLGARALSTEVIFSHLKELEGLQWQFHQSDKRWVEAVLREHEVRLRRLQRVRDTIDARMDGGIINAILALPSVVGSAIGSGLGLGILRAAIAIPARQLPGVQFSSSFVSAAILGSALTLGMALESRKRNREKSEQPDKPVSIDVAFHGALFFGIAHLVVAVINGLWIEPWLIVPMGFLAGLALSLVLYDERWRKAARIYDPILYTNNYWWSRVACWNKWQRKIVEILSTSRYFSRLMQAATLFLLLMQEVSISIREIFILNRVRLVLVALSFVAIQIVFILTGGKYGTGIVIARTGSFYKAAFSHYEPIEEWLTKFCPQWFNYLALMDAALVGIVLTLGIAVGSMLAHRWVLKWRSLN